MYRRPLLPSVWRKVIPVDFVTSRKSMGQVRPSPAIKAESRGSAENHPSSKPRDRAPASVAEGSVGLEKLLISLPYFRVLRVQRHGLLQCRKGSGAIAALLARGREQQETARRGSKAQCFFRVRGRRLRSSRSSGTFPPAKMRVGRLRLPFDQPCQFRLRLRPELQFDQQSALAQGMFHIVWFERNQFGEELKFCAGTILVLVKRHQRFASCHVIRADGSGPHPMRLRHPQIAELEVK